MSDKWEYKFVTLDKNDENDQIIQLNNLGMDGWQVFHAFGDKKNTTYVMKRLLEPTEANEPLIINRRPEPRPYQSRPHWRTGLLVHKAVPGSRSYTGYVTECSIRSTDTDPNWDYVTCRECLEQRPQPAYRARPRIIHKIDDVDYFEGDTATCGDVVHSTNADFFWEKVTCRHCLALRPGRSGSPSWKLTPLERQSYGRRVDSFSSWEIVYSLTEVEAILRRRRYA